MQTYTFTWEAEDGLTMDDITADNFLLACRELSQRYPEDIGADGWCNNMHGGETPITWFRPDGTAI